MIDSGFMLFSGTIIGRTPNSDDPVAASGVVYAARGVAANGEVITITATAPQRSVAPTEEIIPAKLNAPCIIQRAAGRTALWVAELPAIDECQETP